MIPLKWPVRTPLLCLVAAFVAFFGRVAAQDDLLLHDDLFVMGDAGEDPSPDLNRYERLNRSLGADSVRICNGQPCIGWVEDLYPDSSLKHRGYYDAGLLTVYRNYHPNGVLEREFKALDAVKSIMRTYHSNGNIRSEARYADGIPYRYEDHYVDGKLRYEEEKHRKDPYYITMNLYAADGLPVSTLELVDKKKIEFTQKEFHPGGALKCSGQARYDRSRMDTQRIGTWVYYDTAGAVIREEDYADGKLATVR
ncbi:MAG: hypothetical protein KDB84_10840 [Flavobacteriales bacterium]|nr:hypothetical protein [Flavobacteriales bacterium]